MRLDKTKFWVRLRRSLCCPLWRALKWFCPGRRATSLPFLVILILFVYDLFVFISIPKNWDISALRFKKCLSLNKPQFTSFHFYRVALNYLQFIEIDDSLRVF